MRQGPRLQFPERRHRPALAIAASIVAHLLLILGWIAAPTPDWPASPEHVFIVLPPAAQTRVVDIPPLADAPEAAAADEARAPAGPARAPAERRPPARPARAPARPPPGDSGGGGAGVPPPVGAPAELRPDLADGTLWVRPLPLPPKELAQRLTGSRGEMVDSAVTATVQAFLDSIAADPAAAGAELPGWTAEIGGKKFGIDSGSVYIAGLKIPAAVLALLPFPQGNVDQARANRELSEMRRDLIQAARRADNTAEFKAAIKRIRERKEREEEFERNQRTPPPPLPPPDTAVTAHTP